MNHRTLGDTRDCRGCRFWSEMIAQSTGGPVEAMCLNEASPFRGRYTSGRRSCSEWRSGHWGAVDEPPDYGASVRALYASEDAATTEAL